MGNKRYTPTRPRAADSSQVTLFQNEQSVLDALSQFFDEMVNAVSKWNDENDQNKIAAYTPESFHSKVRYIAEKEDELDSVNFLKAQTYEYSEPKREEKRNVDSEIADLNAQISADESKENEYNVQLGRKNNEKNNLTVRNQELENYDERTYTYKINLLFEFVHAKEMIKKNVIPAVKNKMVKEEGSNKEVQKYKNIPDDTKGFLALRNKNKALYDTYVKALDDEIHNNLNSYLIDVYDDKNKKHPLMSFTEYMDMYENVLVNAFTEVGTDIKKLRKELETSDKINLKIKDYDERRRADKNVKEKISNQAKIDRLSGEISQLEEEKRHVVSEKNEKTAIRESKINESRRLGASIEEMENSAVDYNRRINGLKEEIDKFNNEKEILVNSIIPAAREEHRINVHKAERAESIEASERLDNRFRDKDKKLFARMYNHKELGWDYTAEPVKADVGDKSVQEDKYGMIGKITGIKLEDNANPDDVYSAVSKIHINGISASTYFQLDYYDPNKDRESFNRIVGEINGKLKDALDSDNFVNPRPEKTNELMGQIIAVEDKNMMLRPVLMQESETIKREADKNWFRRTKEAEANRAKVKKYNENVLRMCDDLNDFRKDVYKNSDEIVAAADKQSAYMDLKITSDNAKENRRQITLIDALRASKGLDSWDKRVERENIKRLQELQTEEEKAISRELKNRREGGMSKT